MNAKTLKCKDFGLDCPFSITSEDGQEAMDISMAHASKVHADKMAGMSEEEKGKMMEQMKAMVA